MDYQLDLRHYRCPLPLLMAKRALVELKQGDRLYILVDHTASMTDFQLLSEHLAVSYLGDETHYGARQLAFQK